MQGVHWDHPLTLRFGARKVWKKLQREELAKLAESGEWKFKTALEMSRDPQMQHADVFMQTMVDGEEVRREMSPPSSDEDLQKRAAQGEDIARMALAFRKKMKYTGLGDDRQLAVLKDQADHGVFNAQFELGMNLVYLGLPSRLKGLKGLARKWLGMSPKLKPQEVTPELLEGYKYLAQVANEENVFKWQDTLRQSFQVQPAQVTLAHLEMMMPEEKVKEAKTMAKSLGDKLAKQDWFLQIETLKPTISIGDTGVGQSFGAGPHRVDTMVLKPLPEDVTVPERTPNMGPNTVHTMELFRNRDLVRRLEKEFKDSKMRNNRFLGFSPHFFTILGKPIIKGGAGMVYQVVDYVAKKDLTPHQQKLVEMVTMHTDDRQYGIHPSGLIFTVQKAYQGDKPIYEGGIIKDMRELNVNLEDKKLGMLGFDKSLEFLRPAPWAYKTLDKLLDGFAKGDKTIMDQLQLSPAYELHQRHVMELLNPKPGWVSLGIVEPINQSDN